jgi:hypothetical protein
MEMGKMFYRSDSLLGVLRMSALRLINRRRLPLQQISIDRKPSMSMHNKLYINIKLMHMLKSHGAE